MPHYSLGMVADDERENLTSTLIVWREFLPRRGTSILSSHADRSQSGSGTWGRGRQAGKKSPNGLLRSDKAKLSDLQDTSNDGVSSSTQSPDQVVPGRCTMGEVDTFSLVSASVYLCAWRYHPRHW